MERDDIVYFEDEEWRIDFINPLRDMFKLARDGKTIWAKRDEIAPKFKFTEGEECYYRTTYENYECTVEAVLTKRDKPWYVVYVPNFGKYKLVMEFQLLKRKNFEDLEEKDSFYLPSGEKIRILRIEFDDCEGVYKYLIRRQHGEIQLVNKDKLGGWV